MRERVQDRIGTLERGRSGRQLWQRQFSLQTLLLWLPVSSAARYHVSIRALAARRRRRPEQRPASPLSCVARAAVSRCLVVTAPRRGERRSGVGIVLCIRCRAGLCRGPPLFRDLRRCQNSAAAAAQWCCSAVVVRLRRGWCWLQWRWCRRRRMAVGAVLGPPRRDRRLGHVGCRHLRRQLPKCVRGCNLAFLSRQHRYARGKSLCRGSLRVMRGEGLFGR